MGKVNFTDSELEELSLNPNETVASLADALLTLRAAVREHQSCTGHELCWLNDLALWQHLDKGAQYPHASIPIREEFLTQCQRYYESRISGTSYDEPLAKTTISTKR